MVDPSVFSRSTGPTGLKLSVPEWIPCIRDSKTRKIISYVPLGMKKERAERVAKEMADKVNKNARNTTTEISSKQA